VQIADYIGIIANGQLWYQEKIQEDIDLEKLFLEVVKKAGTKYE
ncbi:MAG: lantibiotic ABC transporter ATP-binding protein, partial [Oscillospiraceae bacterium]